nr:hypothetical protein [Tanacetum cinerariifolium]
MNSNLVEVDRRKFSDIGAWYAIENYVQYDKKCSNPTSTISDETIENLNVQIFGDDMVRVQSTIQTLPSFEEYTPPVTYPDEVKNTLGTPIEVEPLNETKLEEVGLNCNHNTPFSSKEVPSFDKLEPQPLLNSPSLDVSLGDVICPEPPLKPHSPDSSRMKATHYLTTQTPPSPHIANSHPKGVYSYYNPVTNQTVPVSQAENPLSSLELGIRTDIVEYGVSTPIGYGVSNFLSNTTYSFKLINTMYPLPLDTAYLSFETESDPKFLVFDFRAQIFYPSSEQILLIFLPMLEEELIRASRLKKKPQELMVKPILYDNMGKALIESKLSISSNDIDIESDEEFLVKLRNTCITKNSHQIRMKIFPLSLADDAKELWISEGEGKITDWEELVENFFANFIPNHMMVKKKC